MQQRHHSRRRFLVAVTGVAVSLAAKPLFGKSQDLTSLTLQEASVLLRRKTASPVDLTQVCLERIETYNPELNAFITVTKDEAIETARARGGATPREMERTTPRHSHSVERQH